VWDKNVGAIHELPLHFLFFLYGGRLKTAISKRIALFFAKQTRENYKSPLLADNKKIITGPEITIRARQVN